MTFEIENPCIDSPESTYSSEVDLFANVVQGESKKKADKAGDGVNDIVASAVVWDLAHLNLVLVDGGAA